MDENLSRLPLNASWPEEGVQSLSAEEIVHKRPEAYLAELMLVLREPDLLKVHKCWSFGKYKESYVGFIMQLAERLKYCEFKILHNAIVKNKLTSFKDNFDELIIEEIKKAI
jgi:hypothetical protein